MNKKRLAINMIANIVAFLVNMGVSFFLSPYIIKTVGKEAYGFVGLANNFVNYAQLITIALNSMAGRFITIKIHNNDDEAANKYFTSVFIANTIMALVMLIPSILIIVFIDRIINVPKGILLDVKLLWALIFINFLLSIVVSTFSLATFVVNRLDLSSIRDIQGNILRVITLVALFSLFEPSVWYLGLVTLICTIFITIYNIYYKNMLLPQIKIKLKYFDVYAIKELMVSGVWNVVTKLGQILSDGLDLLITNLFIDASSMGILAIAKTIPSAITNLLITISGVFSPQLTIQYAKNNIETLVEEIKISMKISGVFSNMALGFLIGFGTMFYSLWVPGENVELIQKVSILTAYGIIVSGAINSLFGVFTITNKLKINSLVVLLNGVLNTVIVFILLKTTNLGIIAVAGVSTTTALIKNLTFTPMYSAKCLGISIKTFYPTLIRYIISSIVITIIFYILANGFNSYTWTNIIIGGLICMIIGGIINYFLLFNSKEKIYIKNSIKSKISRK